MTVCLSFLSNWSAYRARNDTLSFFRQYLMQCNFGSWLMVHSNNWCTWSVITDCSWTTVHWILFPFSSMCAARPYGNKVWHTTHHPAYIGVKCHCRYSPQKVYQYCNSPLLCVCHNCREQCSRFLVDTCMAIASLASWECVAIFPGPYSSVRLGEPTKYD